MKMCYVCNVYFSGKIFTNLKRTHKYVNKSKSTRECVYVICNHYIVLYKGLEHPGLIQRVGQGGGPGTNPLWVLRNLITILRIH